MLTETLVQEFGCYFDSAPEHDTVLWFDPQGEWSALLLHLQGRGGRRWSC